MRRILLGVAFILACALTAQAQESEYSGGGGTAGAITAGVGSGNAGRVPQFASTTSLVDSKMLTSGTNSGTWTLYDSTGGTGVTQLYVRSGPGQSTASQLLIGSTGTGLFESAAGILAVTDGSTGFGSVTAAAYGANTGSSAAASFYFNGDPNTGIYSDSADRLFLSAGGATVFLSTTAFRSTTNFQIGSSDVNFSRVASGTVLLSDGAGGQAGFGAVDAATATVTDALILRHATSGTAAASFGTGLLFQGENAAGTMHDMARISVPYSDAADTSEDAAFTFWNMQGGTLTEGLTLSSNSAGTFTPGFTSASGVWLQATSGSFVISASGDIVFQEMGVSEWWRVKGDAGAGALAPSVDNAINLGQTTLKVRDAYLGTSIQGTRTKTLTDTTATDFVTIGIPTDTSVGGTIEYTITYTSGGNQEIESGVLAFAGQNEAGTEAASVAAVGTALQLPAGTMTNVFAVTTGVDTMTISCDPDSTALAADPVISYRVYVNSGTATVTPIP